MMTALSIAGAGNNFKGLVEYVLSILYILVPILSGLAFIFFFWGLSQFILKDAGNEKTRADGKKKMLWGILALFILLTFRAFMILAFNELGFGNSPSEPSSLLMTNGITNTTIH